MSNQGPDLPRWRRKLGFQLLRAKERLGRGLFPQRDRHAAAARLLEMELDKRAQAHAGNADCVEGEVVEFFVRRQSGGGEYDGSFGINEPERDLPNLRDYGEVLQEARPLVLLLDYPLTREAEVVVEHPQGARHPWTRADFARAVSLAYRQIYSEEEAVAGYPGWIPGTLNRRETTGPWGIWGHDFESLFLESAVQLSDGSWRLSMGS